MNSEVKNKRTQSIHHSHHTAYRTQKLLAFVVLRPLLVSSLFDGFHDEFDSLTCIAGRGEAALVADQGGVAAELLLDDALGRSGGVVPGVSQPASRCRWGPQTGVELS